MNDLFETTNAVLNFFELLILVVGLLVLFVGGGDFVVWLMNKPFKDKIGKHLGSPTGNDDADWKALVKTPNKDAGKLLGQLERTLFFLGIWFGGETIIIGWLAFKAVSKWDAYANITRIPSEFGGAKADNLKFLALKRRWASYVFMRSLIGTLGNLLIAGLVVFLGKIVVQSLE